MTSKLHISIIGLGVIGGSLALALKKHTPHHITGYDCCPVTRRTVIEKEAVHQLSESLTDSVIHADIVILALPAMNIPNTIRHIAPKLKNTAIITDVASTKGSLLTEIPSLLPVHIPYVGGHPMAGSEKSGFTAARADMFEKRPFLFIPPPNLPWDPLPLLTELAKAIGAHPYILSESIHDSVTAQISHLPHITAAALVQQASDSPVCNWNFSLAAGGFYDTTRIASANPFLWSDICLSNRNEVLQALQSFQSILQQVESAILTNDRTHLNNFFTQAQQNRQRLSPSLSAPAAP